VGHNHQSSGNQGARRGEASGEADVRRRRAPSGESSCVGSPPRCTTIGIPIFTIQRRPERPSRAGSPCEAPVAPCEAEGTHDSARSGAGAFFSYSFILASRIMITIQHGQQPSFSRARRSSDSSVFSIFTPLFDIFRSIILNSNSLLQKIRTINKSRYTRAVWQSQRTTVCVVPPLALTSNVTSSQVERARTTVGLVTPCPGGYSHWLAVCVPCSLLPADSRFRPRGCPCAPSPRPRFSPPLGPAGWALSHHSHFFLSLPSSVPLPSFLPSLSLLPFLPLPSLSSFVSSGGAEILFALT
jgi:hypothetical protein